MSPLEGYSNRLISLTSVYGTLDLNNVFKSNGLDNLKYIGKDANYVKRIFNIVASWYCWMIDEIVYTIKRIRYVYKQFGSKDSFIFRILNRDYSQLKKIKFTR